MSDTRFESNARFEQDLRTALRAMAPADVPTALRDAVAAVPRTRPMTRRSTSPLGPLASARSRFALVAGMAAALVVAVAGLAMLLSGGFGGRVAAPSPSSPSASPTSAVSWVRITYQVFGPDAAKGTADQVAADMVVLGRRITQLKLNVSGMDSADDTISMVLQADDRRAMDLLGTTGSVAFVAMGSTPTEVGQSIDLAAHPGLFGSEGITGATVGTDAAGLPTVEVSLAPSATRALATWSETHVGEDLAIVIDGKVAYSAIIEAAIPDGKVELSQTGDAAAAARSAQALSDLLAEGTLPFPLIQLRSEPVPAPAESAAEPSGIVATPVPVESGVAWVHLTFQVRATGGGAATDAQRQAAFDVAKRRLGAIGLPSEYQVTSDVGTVTARADDANEIAYVLRMPGVVSFVPMGKADVSVGTQVDLAANPPLFGNEAVASAFATGDQSGISITFTPAASQTIGAWSAAHAGEHLAIVLDRSVVTSLTVQSMAATGGMGMQLNVPIADPQADRIARDLASALAAEPLASMMEQTGSVPASEPPNDLVPQPSASDPPIATPTASAAASTLR